MLGSRMGVMEREWEIRRIVEDGDRGCGVSGKEDR